MSAKSPVLRSISADDLRDPERASRLLTTALGDTSRAIDGALTLGNLRCIVATLDFTMPAVWVTPDLAGGWLPFAKPADALSYMKNAAGQVLFRGVLDSGTYSNSTPLFTLPTAYLPRATIAILPTTQANATFTPSGALEIHGNGEVFAPEITSIQVGTSTLLNLDGVSFWADDPTPVALEAPFPLRINVSSLGAPASSLLVIACADWTGNRPQAAAYPCPAWYLEGQTLLVTQMVGLLPNRRYKVRVLVLPD